MAKRSLTVDLDVIALGRSMYKAGISGAELSRKMGRSEGYVGGLLHKGSAPMSAIYQIAGTLNIEPEIIMNKATTTYVAPMVTEPVVEVIEEEPAKPEPKLSKEVIDAVECVGVILMSINESLIDLTTAVNDLTEALEGKEGK